MAAIRSAGAGRALLRQSAAHVGERAVLRQPMAGPLSLSSNSRYMSSSSYEIKDDEKKKNLAVSLMKTPTAFSGIGELDEMLDLINSAKDMNRYAYQNFVPDLYSQQAAARTALDEKKLELVSSLLRPDADVNNEYKKKMEEFTLAARLHRQSLLLEELRKQNAKRRVGMVLLGIPVTVLVLEKLQFVGF